jgi:hypothetical protein
MSTAKTDQISRGLERLFSTPSLMNGEDADVYAALYARVEEVAQPKDVWDQMMVSDVVNHFWEQQRYRRCTGTIINSKRRNALENILRHAIGLNPEDVRTVADIYFGVTRYEETDLGGITYPDPAQIPSTRRGVISFLKEHGFDVTDIDRLAMESSVDVLADLENLALKHEIRREAILRELERRREGRRQQRESPGRQKLNGRVRALGEGLADAPPSPCDRYLST